jgi:uncharacterized protein involved in exopolysaccharide biosynthesis
MNAAAQPGIGDHLSIAALLIRVKSRPKTFVAILILTLAAFLSYALLATPQYRGVVKLMPGEPEVPGGGLQSMLGQLGGLAALAGLSFGSVNEQESLALLRSRALFTRFANEQNLLPILFSRKWDAKTLRWRTDPQHTPTMDDAWSMFDKGIRRVSDDPKTQLITLDITWKERHQAADWANELVRLANEEMRQRALRESTASIASYREQLTHTDVVELRQAIYKLMEVQLNRSAVATSRQDYALKVIDPAVVPDARRIVSPRRALLMFIAVPLGFFLAMCVVLSLDFAAQTLADLRRRQ